MRSASRATSNGFLNASLKPYFDSASGFGFVLAGQGDDQRGFVLRVAAQVLGDLQALAAAHRQVDDDGIGMEALGLNAGLEAAVGQLVLVIVIFGQQFLHAVR